MSDKKQIDHVLSVDVETYLTEKRNWRGFDGPQKMLIRDTIAATIEQLKLIPRAETMGMVNLRLTKETAKELLKTLNKIKL